MCINNHIHWKITLSKILELKLQIWVTVDKCFFYCIVRFYCVTSILVGNGTRALLGQVQVTNWPDKTDMESGRESAWGMYLVWGDESGCAVREAGGRCWWRDADVEARQTRDVPRVAPNEDFICRHDGGGDANRHHLSITMFRICTFKCVHCVVIIVNHITHTWINFARRY